MNLSKAKMKAISEAFSASPQMAKKNASADRFFNSPGFEKFIDRRDKKAVQLIAPKQAKLAVLGTSRKRKGKRIVKSAKSTGSKLSSGYKIVTSLPK